MSCQNGEQLGCKIRERILLGDDAHVEHTSEGWQNFGAQLSVGFWARGGERASDFFESFLTVL